MDRFFSIMRAWSFQAALFLLALILACGFAEADTSYLYYADDPALYHWGGSITSDGAASGSKACYCPRGTKDKYPQYGPYINGHFVWPSTTCTVTFRLKTSDNTTSGAVCTLDVTADAGKSTYAKRTIYGSDFTSANVYQNFSISFQTPAYPLPDRWEFRVHNTGYASAADLWIDTTTVSFAGTFSREVPALIHNGKPFFAIGIYEYPTDCHSPEDETRGRNNKDHLVEYRGCGINAYVVETDDSYWGPLTPAQVTAELDTANSYGMKVITAMPNSFNQASRHVAGSSMYNMIQAIKGKPALLMYGTWDEPLVWENHPSLPVNINALINGRNWAESLDSEHKIWLNEVFVSPYSNPPYQNLSPQDCWSKLKSWSQAGSVYSTDIYPCWGASFPDNDLSRVPYGVDHCVGLALDTEAQMGKRPVMMVLQGQGINEYDSDPNNNLPRPIFAETRYMAYASVVHGARGLWWWGTHSIQPTSQLWRDIKMVAGEMRDLQEVFLSANTASRINNIPTGSIYLDNPNLEGVLKVYNGDRYLIVINSSKNAIPGASIRVPGWNLENNNGRIPVLFENRTVSATENGWNDGFGPWDVHVYTDRTTRRPAAPNDFDGDGKSDLVLIKPGNPLVWKVAKSTSGYVDSSSYSFGDSTQGDKPVPADYDGDLKADPAVYRPSTGTWSILTSRSNWTSVETYQFIPGSNNDVPVSGDYDGDGRADLALYSSAKQSKWLIKLSSTGYNSQQEFLFGSADTADKPLAGDWDADGKADIVVFSPGTPQAYRILKSSTGFAQASVVFPGAVGLPIPGDFDGDGICDASTFSRTAAYRWTIARSRNGGELMYFDHGTLSTGDIPLTGDFDEDGRSDLAVYKPSSFQWVILNSFSSGHFANHQVSSTYVFGAAGDKPVGGVVLDASAPIKPVVKDSGAYTSTSRGLEATWSSSDPESGVAEYRYAIGTSPGSTNVVGWTSVGSDTSMVRRDLTLNTGWTYYISVSAMNGDLLWGSTGYSDGVTAVTSWNLGDIRSRVDGEQVTVESGIVTAGTNQLAGAFYVQAIDRSCGIRVESASLSANTGDLVKITGTISTNSGGERVIINPIKQLLGVNKPLPGPLYTSGKDASAHNTGLLLRLFGTITYSDPDNAFFYIDDGSGRSDEPGKPGLKVNCTGLSRSIPITPPTQGTRVIVTGVLTNQRNSLGQIVPVLQLRSQSDIQTL